MVVVETGRLVKSSQDKAVSQFLLQFFWQLSILQNVLAIFAKFTAM